MLSDLNNACRMFFLTTLVKWHFISSTFTGNFTTVQFTFVRPVICPPLFCSFPAIYVFATLCRSIAVGEHLDKKAIFYCPFCYVKFILRFFCRTVDKKRFFEHFFVAFWCTFIFLQRWIFCCDLRTLLKRLFFCSISRLWLFFCCLVFNILAHIAATFLDLLRIFFFAPVVSVDLSSLVPLVWFAFSSFLFFGFLLPWSRRCEVFFPLARFI